MKGWTPTNDIESVVVQIRAQMVVGRARIDFDSPTVTQVNIYTIYVSTVPRVQRWIFGDFLVLRDFVGSFRLPSLITLGI